MSSIKWASRQIYDIVYARISVRIKQRWRHQQDHLIYFNRIPKTGSMTMVELLHRLQKASALAPGSPPRFRSVSSQTFLQFQLYEHDQVQIKSIMLEKKYIT